MSQVIKKSFPSYNAMSRPAMWWGMPIMPMIGLFLSGILSFVITALVLSFIWGVVIALPFLVALCALRLMTAIDDRYIRRMWFALRRLRLNRKYGKQLLLTPINSMWTKYYAARFSQQRFITGSQKGSSNETPD
ncbi:MAG: VirB3 family type IV secretion system protein [Porticoccaceae bacterium]|nr:VirB3 family type IV secretion system protein [Porticoccaceae bacterium]